MKIALIIPIYLLLSVTSIAQIRYYDEVFEAVNRVTAIYFQKDKEALKIDIFSPDGDTADNRTLLLYVHGGGFAGGERDHPDHLKFCESMARKGYVTATMSYTLVMKGKSFSCDQAAPNKINTFLLTARDISRATKFLMDNAEKYGIDRNKIVLLGSSAGAEAILHAGYWKETYKSDKTQILDKDFQYAGLVSMAGAITSLDWIKANSAIPTQLFHGTCDNLVPYGYAPHHYCDAQERGYLMLHGPKSIADHLRNLGKPFYLVTSCYGRHEWASKPIRDHVDLITDFVFNDIISKNNRQLHIILPSDRKETCEDYNTFNFCE
ncbi:MAG TPA: alpha/beta hydrolase [Cyclobacteriaceae bacterium]